MTENKVDLFRGVSLEVNLNFSHVICEDKYIEIC